MIRPYFFPLFSPTPSELQLGNLPYEFCLAFLACTVPYYSASTVQSVTLVLTAIHSRWVEHVTWLQVAHAHPGLAGASSLACINKDQAVVLLPSNLDFGTAARIAHCSSFDCFCSLFPFSISTASSSISLFLLAVWVSFNCSLFVNKFSFATNSKQLSAGFCFFVLLVSSKLRIRTTTLYTDTALYSSD